MVRILGRWVLMFLDVATGAVRDIGPWLVLFVFLPLRWRGFFKEGAVRGKSRGAALRGRGGGLLGRELFIRKLSQCEGQKQISVKR